MQYTSIHLKEFPAILLGVALATAGCGSPSQLSTEDVQEVEQAFTPTQPSVRPNINGYTPSQRLALRNAILDFITQPIIDEHANAHDWHHPSVGELFFIKHHEYLNKLETYLLTHGQAQFVPVPEWDPGTSIPSEFRIADPLVTQAAMNPNPNKPVPPEFADNKLCNFQTASLLAQSVENWHDSVHTAVGGAMGSISTAPGAPIFWLWHGLLDDMYHERHFRCETSPAFQAAIFLSVA
jgi:hypothetical protein